MNKVYFSNKENDNAWLKDNRSGHFKIIVLPTKWWSIAEWKLAIDFNKSFESGFIEDKA